MKIADYIKQRDVSLEKCQLSFLDATRMIYPLLRIGVSNIPRCLKWTDTWKKADPSESHWHLGPVAIESTRQGRGIGSILMKAFIEKMDTLHASSYLETDKDINVTFYERFGFKIIGEEDILGVLNWYLQRPPSYVGQEPAHG